MEEKSLEHLFNTGRTAPLRFYGDPEFAARS